MREVVLRVPRAVVEDVLDRLLLIVPQGVREVPAGRYVDLKLRGDDLPPVAELRHSVGRWPVHVSEGEVSDDWRERRAADYVPDVIGGRLVVRPEWAPAAEAGKRNLVELVLAESGAFGTGTHPTTRTCLELLLGLAPGGGFADLGCGTGVLAILAARLGWRPVSAFELSPEAVGAARHNAKVNRAAIEIREADLTSEPLPEVDGFAANIPAGVHGSVAEHWRVRPRLGLISGFGADEAAGVLSAYAALGLRERRRVDADGWTVVILEAG